MNKPVSKIIAYVLVALAIILIITAWHIRSVAVGHSEPSVPESYQTIEANGRTFSVKVSGHQDSTPVILLHGFPESAAMWKSLMVDLNEMGYYTIAPNQRGYSAEARPKETEMYRINELEADVLALAYAFEIDRFHLITHDWGSAVGWQLATKYPDRIITYTCMSVPHLAAMARAYEEDPEQFEASSYIRGFQTRWIPEYLLARNDYKMLRSVWSEHSATEKDAYLGLFRQKGALTAAINWYRANGTLFEEEQQFDKVDVPTLFIWGNEDIALMRSGAEWTEDYVSGPYRFVEMDAGHWLIQEKYDDVKLEVLAHLAQYSQK